MNFRRVLAARILLAVCSISAILILITSGCASTSFPLRHKWAAGNTEVIDSRGVPQSDWIED